MPKRILEEESDSDSEIKLTTDNEYAKNYDIWRKKEELNKLKTKYGEESLHLLDDEDTSSSSDDDEDGEQLTEEVEKQFFKTLSCLKNKDPRIYDENVRFFDNVNDDPNKTQKKKKKEKPMYINDYERELILKKNGELSDDDENDTRPRSPTYTEEQQKLKESVKNALSKIDEEDDEWGGMLKVRQKTEEEKMKEEAEYKEWLAGQKEEMEDKETELELKPLKDYWNDPNLNDGEKFLRDYILNKKFLSKDDDNYIPTYEEIIHDSDKDLSEDEQNIDRQEEFEHKYNFRFEEPDQDFIKRYPRTMEHSLRKTDDRRKLKRVETKERKQKEKEEKMQELKKLQELKRKEIEEKIEKLKEITGNDNIGFKDEDLDEDFDPEAHDRRMQSLFNDEFYAGAEDDQKPEFPELDEFLGLENWEKWKGEETEGNDEEAADEEYAPHCEDEDFNMDCDYDPKAAVQEELIENTKGKKKRKRKSLFAKAVSQPKPVFDPKDKTYEEYLDEYYKLDCEDIIGDIPCRFKYRKVVPNSFGLTVEEILKANDRELNRWCSLKKALQQRPDHVEKYDQIAYSKKAQNLALKKKILPSLFEEEKPDDGDGAEQSREGKNFNKILQNNEENKDNKASTSVQETEKSKRNKKRMRQFNEEKKEEQEKQMEDTVVELNQPVTESNKKKKKKRKKATNNTLVQTEIVQKEVNNKKSKKPDVEDSVDKSEDVTEPTNKRIGKVNKKKKKKAAVNNTVPNKNTNLARKRKHSMEAKDEVTPIKKSKKGKGFQKNKNEVGISDARLTAYGINPKRFKNKLKFNKK